MDNKTLFSQVAPLKLFFIAALPGAISMLASSLYQLMDGVMVGRILGETPFAAVNLAMPFVIINFAIADLIGVGSSVPIAHALGRKEDAEANNMFTCACIMIVGAGVAVGALMYALAPYMLRALGAEGALLDDAVAYLRIYALCSPLTTIFFAVDNFLRICGVIKGSLVMNVVMSVMCMGLEFLFLFGLRLPVWAAALATCLSMMLCVIGAFIPFFAGKMSLKFVKPRFSRRMLARTVQCGTPNFLNNIAARITSIFMNMLLLRFGGERAVNVYGVLMYAEGIIMPLMYGTCDSLQPAIGFNWGAGDVKRVFSIEKCCYAACTAVSVVAALAMMLFPTALAELFLDSPDEETISMMTTAMRLFAIGYFVRWASFAAQSFFLALGKSLQATVLSVSTALVVPLVLIGAFYPLELTGLWLNVPVTYFVVGALAAALLFAFLRKLKSSPPHYRADAEDENLGARVDNN
ncbi:MAG TPA: MATE family efflux transporter [Candidatus Ornithoclostridium faecigallinarum]|nr:MATE family efflux transporter [Candidatus Ornithoclostridium faecigallinarum]